MAENNEKVNAFTDEEFRAKSFSFSSIEDRRKFEQNLIKYDIVGTQGPEGQQGAIGPMGNQGPQINSGSQLVSAGRDVIFTFYIPPTTSKISAIKLNLYFPGLQVSDYPDNSSIMYLPYLHEGSMAYTDGVFEEFGQDYYSVGTGATGTQYVWFRAFLKFNISVLSGFKLNVCELKWLLASKAFAGSGANAQHSNVLHAVADYGTLDKDDWAIATDVDYGNVNVYTDAVGYTYTKSVITRVQSLVDASNIYAAFRFKSSGEPTDVNNANTYRLNIPLLYCELAEDTTQAVSLYANNGAGFGSQITSFSSATESFDLTQYFSGTGKKQIKFTASRIRRIEAIVRIGLRDVLSEGV